jgi:hypothetical protein
VDHGRHGRDHHGTIYRHQLQPRIENLPEAVDHGRRGRDHHGTIYRHQQRQQIENLQREGAHGRHGRDHHDTIYQHQQPLRIASLQLVEDPVGACFFPDSFPSLRQPSERNDYSRQEEAPCCLASHDDYLTVKKLTW